VQGFVNEVMNLRGLLSPEDGWTTIIRNSSVFSVRYGLDSHLVAVSRRPGTDSGGPGFDRRSDHGHRGTVVVPTCCVERRRTDPVLCLSRHSSVGIVTRQQAGQSRNVRWIPCRVRRFLSEASIYLRPVCEVGAHLRVVSR